MNDAIEGDRDRDLAVCSDGAEGLLAGGVQQVPMNERAALVRQHDPRAAAVEGSLQLEAAVGVAAKGPQQATRAQLHESQRATPLAASETDCEVRLLVLTHADAGDGVLQSVAVHQPRAQVVSADGAVHRGCQDCVGRPADWRGGLGDPLLADKSPSDLTRGDRVRELSERLNGLAIARAQVPELERVVVGAGHQHGAVFVEVHLDRDSP